MRRISALILLVAAGSLTVAACGGDDKEKSASGDGSKEADTSAKVEFTEPDANTTEGSKGVRAEAQVLG